MAFTTVPKSSSIGGRAPLRNKVRIGRGSAKNNSVPMFLASDVAAATGIDTSVSIMVGTGDDTGLLLVSPSPSGFKVGRNKAKSATRTISLPKRLFREVPAVAMTVRHEITPDGLVVHLGRLLVGTSEPVASLVSAEHEARAA